MTLENLFWRDLTQLGINVRLNINVTLMVTINTQNLDCNSSRVNFWAEVLNWISENGRKPTDNCIFLVYLLHLTCVIACRTLFIWFMTISTIIQLFNADPSLWNLLMTCVRPPFRRTFSKQFVIVHIMIVHFLNILIINLLVKA